MHNEEVAMKEAKRRERQSGKSYSLYKCAISGRLATKKQHHNVTYRKSKINELFHFSINCT